MATAARTAVVIVGILLTGAVGCSSSTTHQAKSGDRATPAPSAASTANVPAGGGAIPIGAGPQAGYSVQAQPAPGSCHYRYTADKQPLPDAKCTPGVTSPAVTQATMASTICKPGGYTSTIRPSANITGKEKAENAKSYGYTGPMGDSEYDHLISLQLGGDPNDPRNLWVEPPSPDHVPGKGPNNPKDVVETHLHTALCKNQVTLAAVQQAVTTDWTTAEAKLGIKAGSAPSDAPVESD